MPSANHNPDRIKVSITVYHPGKDSTGTKKFLYFSKKAYDKLEGETLAQTIQRAANQTHQNLLGLVEQDWEQ